MRPALQEDRATLERVVQARLEELERAISDLETTARRKIGVRRRLGEHPYAFVAAAFMVGLVIGAR